MFLKNEKSREGQSKEYNLTMNVDLSAATEIRLYYKTKDGSGYWDLTTGVSRVGLYTVHYVHNDIPQGLIVLDVWAKWANDANFIRISDEDLSYNVTKFPP